MEIDDEKFMRQALILAEKGKRHTSPNPMVGAVIVKNGTIIGSGYHHAAGQPHAEIEAIRSLQNKSDAKGATLYVTLEPCSTYGRTPPCTDAILHAQFSRVVIGMSDPNPKHAGAAYPLLRTHGIEVRSGVLQKECEQLNRPFCKWITQRLPWVIAKAGMTLDGNIRRAPGRSRFITGEASHAHAHTIRAQVDAIMVGAGTVREDLPQLTVRGIPNARQPWRIVVSRSKNLPMNAPLFTDAFKDKTRIESEESLREILRNLARLDMQSVLIEGGANLLGQAFAESLVDEVYFYIAPLLTGGSFSALRGHFPQLSIQAWDSQRIDQDILIHGFL